MKIHGENISSYDFINKYLEESNKYIANHSQNVDPISIRAPYKTAHKFESKITKTEEIEAQNTMGQVIEVIFEADKNANIESEKKQMILSSNSSLSNAIAK